MKPPAPILPPDSHYLSAAYGWLDLGNPAEARAELDGIRPEFQNHGAVLGLRWAICAELQDWPAALLAARCLAEVAPELAGTWLNLAYALRRVPEGGLAAAQEVLRPAFERFPAEAVIPYNLACYACQAGQLDEARRWLDHAFQRGKPDPIKRMALADPDLRPLWEELKKL